MHLHGHNARAVIRLERDSLDPTGMVVDFGDIGDYVKAWINTEIDHNMLLCREDPVLPLLETAGERYYVTEENPTAEHIARHIAEALAASLPDGAALTSVSVAEAPGCIATYRTSRT